ncbi:HU family DNA-binding protein [Shewanella colwelliana]|uniref:DNA-binding protein n=1 Tax=Shewanella colwelliana TaxID=23 RepID=A0A1E5IRQ1_SHECO|nr:HU family DNA-binding protein [Shewanella colwelliana]MCZ4337171.1 HU family DNA-binding protein [Shewanella colwelliana]MDX1279987.1 HU family DNA-binding protein [Shewanella colwelliana]OEG73252.1 DNA-binding protein HU [Shewanella colwelliana]GIU24735.1 DNA-binding protein [Shewanella colwelliana]GIU38749.1 DNA-binding protein [Shewanella colwelliana]
MNKTELVAKMAESAELTKAEAARALKSFEQTVAEAMKNGEKISIVGFGSFETSSRAARTGRNPQTGKEIQIPAATVPKFKAGKTLKDSVN